MKFFYSKVFTSFLEIIAYALKISALNAIALEIWGPRPSYITMQNNIFLLHCALMFLVGTVISELEYRIEKKRGLIIKHIDNYVLDAIGILVFLSGIIPALIRIVNDCNGLYQTERTGYLRCAIGIYILYAAYKREKFYIRLENETNIDLQNEDEVLPPLPAEISPSVRACVEKAMIPQRSKRTQSVAEFVALLRDEERTVVDPEAQQRAEEERRRKEAEEQAAREKAAREKAEAEARALAAQAEAERKAREEASRQQQNSAQKTSSRGWLRPVGIVCAIVALVLIGTVVYKSVVAGARQEIVTKSFTVKGVTFDMMLVKGGTFTMGATDEQQDPWDNEKPPHQVTLTNDYYIGKTEVTQALWEAVMGSNHSFFKGNDLPVESVSWDDCQTFITKLNAETGEHFRLPTEAEWEFAARGGNNSNHTQYSGSSDPDAVAWYEGNSGRQTHPVATKQANELGIYDMSGNVWEWCQDWYGDYSSDSQTDPQGPNSGLYRVFRGGSWDFNAGDCRSSCRYSFGPDYRGYDFGLRLVLSE